MNISSSRPYHAQTIPLKIKILLILKYHHLTLFLLAAIFFSSSCITVDQYGNPISKSQKSSRNRRLSLNEINIRPGWTDEEKNISFVFAGLPDNPPAQFILQDLPPVADQGKQPSGTAWAAGYLANSYYQRIKKGEVNYLCSTAFLYNQLNDRNRGVEIIDALKLLKESGCPHDILMPYNDNDNTTRPNAESVKDASLFKISGFGRVDFTDIGQIKAHLNQNSPIIVTLKISQNFIELKNELWEYPDSFFMGRHTVAVIGYDDIEKHVIIQNSAGKMWGKEGLAKIPYDWFVRVTGHAYVLW